MSTSASSDFPSSYPPFVWNFAYGSNMHEKVLSGRRGIYPKESIPAILPGWQLTFDLSGIAFIEPCFGNVKPNPACEVHGVLHQMTDKEFMQLLRTEGGSGVDSSGYIPTLVKCTAYDGREIEAYTLVVRQSSHRILKKLQLPSARYMGLLRNGASASGLHPDYVRYLGDLPKYPFRKLVVIPVGVFYVTIFLCLTPLWIVPFLYRWCTSRPHARQLIFSLVYYISSTTNYVVTCGGTPYVTRGYPLSALQNGKIRPEIARHWADFCKNNRKNGESSAETEGKKSEGNGRDKKRSGL